MSSKDTAAKKGPRNSIDTTETTPSATPAALSTYDDANLPRRKSDRRSPGRYQPPAEAESPVAKPEPADGVEREMALEVLGQLRDDWLCLKPGPHLCSGCDLKFKEKGVSFLIQI